jgi:immune inhibitor A
MTSWERFQLGFINNYAVGFAGEKAEFKLGPSEYNTKKPQALFVVLPDKVVTTDIGDPNTGSSFYYSNADNDLDTSMTKSVTLPAGAVSLSAQVRYNIESDWDYAYVTVNGTEVATNLSTNTNPNSQNFGEGITGTTNGSWVTLTADLSAYAGQTVTLGFRYWMDGAQIGDPSDTTSAPGIAIDDIDVTGQATDGAEGTDPAAWTYDPADGSGFHASTGTESFSYFNAYVVESRTYQSYDEALLKGPYNFTTDTMVEHFPYQDGVMIWYWDESVHDNNVGDHPGSGWILPVDAHPAVNVWSDDGSQMRPRINAYDSSFTTKKTDKITLHNPATGEATTIGGLKHVDVFNDGLRDLDGTSIYWAPSDPSDAPGTSRYQAEWNSVDVPDTGTVIKVQGLSGQGDVTIKLNK